MNELKSKLDKATRDQIRAIARARGIDESAVVQEALSAYLAKRSLRAKGVGAYLSGRDNLSEASEEILRARAQRELDDARVRARVLGGED